MEVLRSHWTSEMGFLMPYYTYVGWDWATKNAKKSCKKICTKTFKLLDQKSNPEKQSSQCSLDWRAPRSFVVPKYVHLSSQITWFKSWLHNLNWSNITNDATQCKTASQKINTTTFWRRPKKSREYLIERFL